MYVCARVDQLPLVPCGRTNLINPQGRGSNTSVGRKFAPVAGLSHDLVCSGSIYHVHFAWQVWHGQLSPRFKFNKLKSFSGVEIDQNHVDKRILGGKGFCSRTTQEA